jgi:phosphomevalonate kinase
MQPYDPVTTAPGKVVLGGEYAVLYGAPAIAASVNRRARVSAEIIDGAHNELCMPGFIDGCWRFACRPDGTPDWLDSSPQPGAFALFESALSAAGGLADNGLRLTLDTRAFIDHASGSKLGFGSSAALTVALMAFLRRQDGPALLPAAMAAHRAFQGGEGSGVDIACAVDGGIIGYLRDPVSTEKLSWPAGLHVLLLWSGKPAATTAKIQQLNARLRNPDRLASLALLCDEARALRACWHDNNAAALLAQFGIYTAALHDFDRDQSLGIFSAGHARVYAAASEFGLVYKPCGAGGGDIGAAISLDAAALDAFSATAAQLGFAALDTTLGDSGVQIHGRKL